MGGRLIRRIIRVLRDLQVELPISSHILLAVSGGLDSVALALLLAKYGRKVVDPSRLSILHVNHGWRGESSEEDARFVANLGVRLGLPVKVARLDGPPRESGLSWENEGRKGRKRVFSEALADEGAFIFSAHHADDFAETMLWRVLTGGAESHGGGIVFRHGAEVRPFLTTRKSELREFLKEEKQEWREDSTNHEGRFLRSRMRRELMPVVEKLFPKAVDHLVALGLRAQCERFSAGDRDAWSSQEDKASDLQNAELAALFGTLGIRVKRSHWDWVGDKMNGKLPWKGEIHLPEGWRLVMERQNSRAAPNGKILERWVLERVKSLESKRNSKGESE